MSLKMQNPIARLGVVPALVLVLAGCGRGPAGDAGQAGPTGDIGPAGPAGTTAAVATHTTCTAQPTSASGAQMAPGGVQLTYEIYRYSDGAALVSASDARQEGERSRTTLFSAKEAAADLNLPIHLRSDVDTASGGDWAFSYRGTEGDRGAQANYFDPSSIWNGSSFWMFCATVQL